MRQRAALDDRGGCLAALVDAVEGTTVAVLRPRFIYISGRERPQRLLDSPCRKNGKTTVAAWRSRSRHHTARHQHWSLAVDLDATTVVACRPMSTVGDRSGCLVALVDRVEGTTLAQVYKSQAESDPRGCLAALVARMVRSQWLLGGPGQGIIWLRINIGHWLLAGAKASLEA